MSAKDMLNVEGGGTVGEIALKNTLPPGTRDKKIPVPDPCVAGTGASSKMNPFPPNAG
jgi:hypothetical protein